MGTCLSKKNGSSNSPNKSVSQLENSVTVTLSKSTEPEVSLKKKQDPESAPQDEVGEAKKEIFIIKHRKSHDDREKTTTLKNSPCIAQPQQGGGAETNEEPKIAFAPSTPNVGIGVRTSSCTKEEVDAILIQCGRLSRSSSARKYSGSKRSFDFDHCDNDTTSNENDQRKANGTSDENDGVAAAESRRNRQSPRRSPRSQGRRRTPSREREQSSSSRERRVSRSPGRRSSDTTNANANASNNNNNTSSRPGKMVSVPATVTSLVMDKSNNCGGESGTKRITVKRNVGDVGSRGAASPRAQSPARVHGNVARDKVLGENQQPSLSRNNSSRKAEQSPYRRNPLSEVDTNSKVQQNKPKIEVEANQKSNGKVALEKGASVKTKERHVEESSVLDNSAIVKTTMVSSGIDNLKPQGLTRSRSSRRSRDLDINPEPVVNVNVNPTNSYASLLLEDIQNFYQKNTPPAQQQQQQPSTSLPACLTKACSILEAVADLNFTTTTSNFSDGAFSEDRISPSTQQSIRNEYNAQFGYGKRVPCSKDPFIESEVVVSDDVMEPSLHKYVTVKRGGGVLDMMEDQESSGSNSFTVSSSGQHNWGNNISCSSWEPNSADSTDSWTSRLNSREEGQKKTLKSSVSCEGKKCLNGKKKGCDHEHSSGIGRGRLGSNKSLNTLPVAAATT